MGKDKLDDLIKKHEKEIEEEKRKKKHDDSFAGDPDQRGGNGKERVRPDDAPQR